jgi:erythromycin esterase-like protein
MLDTKKINSETSLIKSLRQSAVQLHGAAEDYDPLLQWIGEADFVLLGEASHGTHEFYRARAVITQRLIQEKGFTAVAVEADWPDAYRVNRYIRGQSSDADAIESLGGFRRFPTWMWRNADVLNFIGWLREYNDAQTDTNRKAGFYGIDLYSLHSSIEAVLTYLDRVDPDAAARARQRYGCFEQYGEEPQEYGYAARFGLTKTCEDEVVRQLLELQRRAAAYANLDGRLAADDYFYAEQNARLVKNAEEYYRTMFGGRISSWNLRDRHMTETLVALSDHLKQQNNQAKIVVWAHNSHLGDARATDMGKAGELNVGQLVRQLYQKRAFLVGFTTHSGTVTAASYWGGSAERKPVRPALLGSYELLFHETEIPRFMLHLRDQNQASAGLQKPLLERAIGVIYAPQTERASHYFQAHLPQQFDAVLHFDTTRAVEPLERTVEWEAGEAPETYPSGI